MKPCGLVAGAAMLLLATLLLSWSAPGEARFLWNFSNITEYTLGHGVSVANMSIGAIAPGGFVTIAPSVFSFTVTDSAGIIPSSAGITIQIDLITTYFLSFTILATSPLFVATASGVPLFALPATFSSSLNGPVQMFSWSKACFFQQSVPPPASMDNWMEYNSSTNTVNLNYLHATGGLQNGALYYFESCSNIVRFDNIRQPGKKRDAKEGM